MIDGRYVDLLVRHGTGAQAHAGGRSLLDHLVGTHDLLEQWGNTRAVCLGGLLHSIYGTTHFQIRSVALERRRDVAAVVGERAEFLAYLFCVTDRAEFFQRAAEHAPVLWDRVAECALSISPEVVRDLIEIEVANYVDQFDPALTYPKSFLNRIDCMMEMGQECMSPAAATAFAKLRAEVGIRLGTSANFQLASAH